MNKHYLHHLWRKLQPLNHWLFFGLFLVSSLLSVYALRANNLEMVRLREAVVRADETNGDVEKALQTLRQHVHGHMNTNLSSGDFAIKPPIQLKYRYERLITAERERVAAVNAKIYTDAQADCERRFPAGLSGSGRIPCIQEYVTAHGAKEQPIPDELYKFDFVSPIWSPDLAGWSMVLSGLLLLIALVRFGLERWMRRQLEQ